MLGSISQIQKSYRLIGLILLAVGISYLSFATTQSDFYRIIISYSIAFGGYLLVLKHRPKQDKDSLLLSLSIAAIPLITMPNLSDDVYRFIWDGLLTGQGISPYSSLPSDIVNDNISGLDQQLFDELNSPDYYTIYPPISQIIFFIGAKFGSTIYQQAIILKSIYYLIHVVGIVYLFKLESTCDKLKVNPILYALNPLVIIEGIGNLHSEVIAIPFLIMAVYYFRKHKLLSVLALSVAIAIKIVPLLLLPFLAFRKPVKENWRYLILAGLCSIVLFLPVLWGLDITNFSQSIDLYFRKFEFNASIYYVLRAIGRSISGYNLIAYIGPLMGITVFALIMSKAYRLRNTKLPYFFEFGTWAFVVFLLLSTTIHPWYVMFPLVLSSFTKLKTPLAWSFLIMLSYFNYKGGNYHENLWVIGLEYLLLFVVILFDLRSLRESTQTSH